MCVKSFPNKKKTFNKGPSVYYGFCGIKMMGAHENDRESMRGRIGEDCAMIARDDGKKEVVMGVSVHN